MAAGAWARPAPRWLKALGEPLSAAQLRRLEEHRYSVAGVSLLEPPLQLYWTWLLQWIPLWMAPNSITLLGLAINLLTTLLLISYCPTVTEEVGPAACPPADPQLLSPGAPRPRPEPSSPRPGCASGGARRAPRAAEPLGAAEGLTPPLPQRRSRPERSPARPEAVTPLPGPMSTPSLPQTAEGLSRSLPSPVSTPTLLRAADGRSRPLGAGSACLPGRRPIPRQVGGGQAVGSFAHWALNTPSSVPPGSGDCGWVGQARDAH